MSPAAPHPERSRADHRRTDLRELAEPTPLTDLRLWAGDAPVSQGFVPHGPTIVVME
jgi:hypothetical protein